MSKQHRWISILLVLVGASCYGLTSSVIKFAYMDGWDHAQITTVQMTMAAVWLWVLLLSQPKAWSNPFRGPWLQLAGIGIFGLTLSTLLLNKALSEMDATLAIVLLFQFTWMTIAMECTAERKMPKRNRLFAVGMIMAGTLLSVNIFQADWHRFSVTGIALGLGSAFTYALFLFFTGRTGRTLHPIMKSAIMITSAIPVLVLIFPVNAWIQPDGTQLLLWGLLLGLLGQVIPAIAYNTGIPRIGSSLAATLGAMELPVAVISAFFLLEESVQMVQWFGMLLILAGIVMAEKQEAS
jgi:drug/metabolite transporter (DMT)-like permease